MVVLIATLAVPNQLGVVALYILMGKLGWNGQLQAVIVPSMVTAFGVFYMRQFILDAVPDELIEAARVDGASTLRIYASVVFPALRPAVGVLGLFTFAATWNDFQWPLITLSGGEHPTVQVALSNLASGQFVLYSHVPGGLPHALLRAGRQIVAHHGRSAAAAAAGASSTPRVSSRPASGGGSRRRPTRSRAPRPRTGAARRSGTRSRRCRDTSPTAPTVWSPAITTTAGPRTSICSTGWASAPTGSRCPGPASCPAAARESSRAGWTSTTGSSTGCSPVASTRSHALPLGPAAAARGRRRLGGTRHRLALRRPGDGGARASRRPGELLDHPERALVLGVPRLCVRDPRTWPS